MVTAKVQQQTGLSILQFARRLAFFFFCGFLVVSGNGCGQPDVPSEEKPASPTSIPAAVPGAAAVETENPQTQPLGASGRWKYVPPFLDGAEIQTRPIERKKGGSDLACTVKTEGVVVIAAAPSAQAGNRFLQQQGATSTEVPGWVAVGTIRQRETAGPDDMTLFRREFKTGEKFEFTSPSWSMPFLVVLKEKNIAPVLAQKAAVVPLLKISHLIPPARPEGLNAESVPNVVMLKTHEVDPGTQGPSILRRELVRQAFLMAARDELGLATRDASLREAFPREPEPASLPFDILVVATLGQPVRVTIFRQSGREYEVLLEKSFDLGVKATFEELVAHCEALSRQEFVEFLKTTGLNKRAPEQAAVGQSSGELAAATDFNIIAQFASLRRLHTAMQSAGESAELLGGLARTYAQIGAETAFLWSPAHKVFEARALLYAERLVHQSSGSPQALWNRAYVRAVVGRHQAALDDLAQAAKAAPPDDAKSIPPDWIEVIRAHCEFDRPKLIAADQNERLRPLSRYLQMLQQEFATDNRARLESIGKILEVSPNSFRAMDLLGPDSPLGIEREARQRVLELFPASLYLRMEEVPSLPEEAAVICQEQRRNDDPQESRDEMETRIKLIALLNEAARSSTDRAEPSLGVLATLIQEIGFVHAWRMAEFVRYSLAAPADDTINAIEPLVEGHPYRMYLDTMRSDRSASDAAVKALTQSIDTTELELTEAQMLSFLGGTGRAMFEATFYSLAFFRFDPVYRDLTRLVLSQNNEYMPHHNAELKAVSPHAPVTVVGDITAALNMKMPQSVLEDAAQWEKSHNSDPTVLAALERLYLALERDDDALRIAKREFEVSPELRPCLQLARLYEKKGDLENWKATLDEFLKQESFGLEHSAVQVEFANHYMAHKEWEKALPYAVEAAETWSSASLMTAHRCYAGMKDWTNAELYIRRSAERYPQNAIEYFLWCKRTGKGDAELARRLTETYYESLGDPPPPEIFQYHAVFKELCGEPEAAMRIWSAGFEKNNDPYNGLNAALIAHDLGQGAERDRLLEQIVMRGRTYLVEDRAREELINFASMIRQQTKAGKSANFDEEKFEAIIRDARTGEPTNLHFFAGRFLAREGQVDHSRKHLMQAATAPNLKLARTLASAMLLQQNVKLEETRDKE